ncbi:MAG: hypothetical protein Q8S33_01355 [Myxococcales bacterium]|nr:hypothetical protein [Myxococcales bacterium]
MRLTSFVVLVGLLIPLSSEAGILSLLSKSGRAARVGSGAVKLSRAARLARVATGVSTVVVAERAAASMVGLGADAAHAGYLARGASGELVMATARTSPAVVDDLGKVVGGLAENGVKPRVVLDPSVAATPEALAALPVDAELAVMEGAKQFPVKRVNNADGTSSFLVDHGGDLVDLADYASQFAGDGEEEESSDIEITPGLISWILVVTVIGAWKLLSKK